MDLSHVLQNTLSHEKAVRENAAEELRKLEDSNFRVYATLLAEAVSKKENSDQIKLSAALLFKNGLKAKKVSEKERKARRWCSLENRERVQIKNILLEAARDTSQAVGTGIAQAAESIGSAELQTGGETDIASHLVRIAEKASTASMRKTGIVGLGFLYEENDFDQLESLSGSVLNVVVFGMQDSEAAIRAASVETFRQMIPFIRGNIEKPQERDFVLSVLLGLTKDTAAATRTAALHSFGGIIRKYYEEMGEYLEKGVFEYLFNLVLCSDEHLATESIETWMTVFEVETDKNTLHEETFCLGDTFGERLTERFLFLLCGGIPEESEWCKEMAAAVCLSALLQTVSEGTFKTLKQYIFGFVSGKISSERWEERNAALLSLSAVLDRKASVEEVVSSVPFILQHLRDQSTAVRDTTAWLLGKVYETAGEIPEDVTKSVLAALSSGLGSETAVSTNCAWSLCTVLPAAGEEGMCFIFSAGYELLGKLAEHSGEASNGKIHHLLEHILGELEKEIDANSETERIPGQCSVVSACVSRLGERSFDQIDRTIAVFVSVLGAGRYSADALLSCVTVFATIGEMFIEYADGFLPHLYSEMANAEDCHAQRVAVGLGGDIAGYLGARRLHHTERILSETFCVLQNPDADSSVKPAGIVVIGDIALGVGGGVFKKYLEPTMGTLQGACLLVDPQNEDEEYILELAQTILETFISVVLCFKEGTDRDELVPFLPFIVSFIERLFGSFVLDDVLLRHCGGLLGDVSEFGVRERLGEDWVGALLNTSQGIESQETVNTLQWAARKISQL
ncbi:MAG: importin subunit beta-1 (Kap95) [Amphiamblys sp. WSBS2006]|nr:MAG: importin subunit beta-1 (Kap95) [Amphiamblys sp. WSBS2006]